MSTADEIFASVMETEGHFVINDDKSITVPDCLKNLAVQYDHNVETVTFDCPRYWDGLDLSNLTPCINYIRADKYEGTYNCGTVVIDPENENIIHITWTITRNVTLVAGTIKFVVCMRETLEDDSDLYAWHSQLCSSCAILAGIKCSGYVEEAPVTPGIATVSGETLITTEATLSTGKVIGETLYIGG